MSKFANMIGMTREELLRQIREKQHELVALRMSVKMGQERNTAKLVVVKKDIARLMTALNQVVIKTA